MTDWNKLKVVDLKAELSKRGLPQTGLKAALVARLVEADSQDGFESEATIQNDLKNDASSVASPDTISSTALPQPSLSGTLPQISDNETPLVELRDSIMNEEPGTNVPSSEVVSHNEAAVISENEAERAEKEEEDTRSTSNTSQFLTRIPAGLNSTQFAVDSREVVEDTLKRKRRSQSPPPASGDDARKKLKTGHAREVYDEVITTRADAEWVERHNAVDQESLNAQAAEFEGTGGVFPEPTIVDTSKAEVVADSIPIDQDKSQTRSLPGTPTKTRDSRFTGLFAQPSNRQASPEVQDIKMDRNIAPAIHPATSALYIKNLMRPLQGPLLQSHLTMLATAPDNETDLGVIDNFYLDPIKTHAFVVFKSLSAAARVRNAFHDHIWPDEKNRKHLWVDFVPVEKAEEWIAKEMATNSGPRSQKKWEVDYRVNDDRQVTVVLQEVNGVRPIQPVRQPTGPATISTASRGFDPPSGPRGFSYAPPKPAMNVAKLNELFNCTATKPVLYFRPVSKELANQRLDNIDSALSKDAAAGRRITGEIHRYTFENADELVDRGPEIYSGIRPPANSRVARLARAGGLPQHRDVHDGREGRRGSGYSERRFEARRDGRSNRRY